MLKASVLDADKETYTRYISKLLGYDVSRDRVSLIYFLKRIDCTDVYQSIVEARSMIKNRAVTVIGPNITNNLNNSLLENTILIGADGASWNFYNKTGRMPEIIVTDLDGPIELYYTAMELGKIIVVHPHGDNINRISFMNSLLGYSRLIVTSQTEEFLCSINPGGFTDGDRAVYFATYMGAKTILICCFSKEPVWNHKSFVGNYVEKKEKIRLGLSLLDRIKKKVEVKFIS